MADQTLEDPKDAGPSPPEEVPEAKPDPAPEEPAAEVKKGGKKKRGRQKKADSSEAKKSERTPEPKKRKKAPGTPATPVERPSRERKTVERFAALTPQKSPAKTVLIQQGSGTMLKDIPNVLFKLNKRKADENLQQLHVILYSRKMKAYHLKKNILQFSGFVWTENKEKQKGKVCEKLEKYTKDKLLDFCEILDIPVSKAATRKDIAAKVLEFLESPHVTRDVVLADKDQGSKKRKRKQRHAKAAETGEKKKRGRKSSLKPDDMKEKEVEGEDASADEEGNDESPTKLEKDVVESDSEENNERNAKSENDEAEPESPANKNVLVGKKGSKSKDKECVTPKKDLDSKTTQISSPKDDSEGKKGAKKETKKTAKSSSSQKSDARASAKKGASTTKGKKQNDVSSEDKNERKEVSKTPAKTNKEKGKSKSQKTVLHPTREEMHSVVSEILKDVDFNTATLADILKQLGSHFQMDLMNRKAEVKSIIEEVINNMTDEDGEDEEEGDGAKEEENDDDGSEDANA